MLRKSHLVRKQIYIDEELLKRLREYAARSEDTESAVIREALVEYLVREERRQRPKEENPVLQMAGLFEGTPDCRDVSADIDRYLAESMLKKDYEY